MIVVVMARLEAIRRAGVALGLIFSLGVLGMTSSCSSVDKNATSAEAAFQLAKEYENEDRYEEAIKRYQEIRSQYPYSKYAVAAELAIADTYFKEESFIEAQVSYQNFKDLHPKHPQIDYVIFRLAMSHFNLLAATSDRDLSQAPSAVSFFDEVVKNYPTSTYAKEAGEKRDQVHKMLAEKEEYIGEFYFKRKECDSALPRYLDLIKKYPQWGKTARILSHSVVCLVRERDVASAKKYLKELKDLFPGTIEYQEALKEVNRG